jgi:hypothetical protein
VTWSWFRQRGVISPRPLAGNAKPLGAEDSDYSKKEEFMRASDNITREVFIEELNLHKAEFSALRNEILYWIDSQKQYLNLSLVAIAAGLGFGPTIVEQRAFVILLLYPFVFHVLLW